MPFAAGGTVNPRSSGPPRGCSTAQLQRLSDVRIPVDSGDFRLMDARVVRSIRDCREQHRFVRGLVAWTGFRSAPIQYDRPARFGNDTLRIVQAVHSLTGRLFRILDFAAAPRLGGRRVVLLGSLLSMAVYLSHALLAGTTIAADVPRRRFVLSGGNATALCGNSRRIHCQSFSPVPEPPALFNHRRNRIDRRPELPATTKSRLSQRVIAADFAASWAPLDLRHACSA